MPQPVGSGSAVEVWIVGERRHGPGRIGRAHGFRNTRVRVPRDEARAASAGRYRQGGRIAVLDAGESAARIEGIDVVRFGIEKPEYAAGGGQLAAIGLDIVQDPGAAGLLEVGPVSEVLHFRSGAGY